MTHDEPLQALIVFEGLFALVIAIERLQSHTHDELRARNVETSLPGIRVALNDHPQHLRGRYSLSRKINDGQHGRDDRDHRQLKDVAHMWSPQQA